jgi:hypothetical protein
MKNLELFYNFCGTFEKQLRSDYKKHKVFEQKITYPQFCILAFIESLKPKK